VTKNYPLHPDDAAMLMDIRRYLIGFRITNGWTQEELSQKINGTKGAVWPLESDPHFQWRFSRLQQWANAFGLKLSAELVFDWGPQEELAAVRLTSFVRRDQFVKVFAELADTDPRWQRSYLIASLKAARQGRGWDQGELGRRLGVTAGAVSRWEMDGDQILLSKLLTHARALDGRLMLQVSR
jgi:transcriptional regulator with XRE-family HTH domain